MPKCSIESCDKQVTSPNITGELCTSCFFAQRNGKKSLAERAPMSDSLSPALSKADQTPEFHKQIEEEIKEEEKKEKEYLCDECGENHPTPKDGKEKHCLVEHKPALNNKQIPNDGKKYCQSCLERGFGLKLATRLWKVDYFICEECYVPLLNNVIGTERAEVERVQDLVSCDSPALNQFYDLLSIPEALRFTSTDSILNHRNDIFNHHATALVNVPIDAVKERIEFLQIILFQIKVNLEPLTDYINKIKALERAQNQVDKTKESKDRIKGPSKVKLSAMEKEAKSLGLTVEQYGELIKKMRQAEFDKITGNVPSESKS